MASQASMLASWGVDFGFWVLIFNFLGIIFGALEVNFGSWEAPWGRLGPSWAVRVVLSSTGPAAHPNLGQFWVPKREPR